MRTFKLNTAAAMLLAGTAAFTIPAIAQTGSTGATVGGSATVGGEAGGSQKRLPDASATGGAAAKAETHSGGMKADTNAQAQTGSTQKQMDSGATTTGDAAAKADAPKAGSEKAASDNSARELAPGQRKASGDVNTATEAAPGQRKASGDVNTARDAAPGQMKNGADTDKPSGETTASVNITTEQRTQVRDVIVREKVAPAKIDFSVSVGVAVPKTVVLHPLPSRIVEIVPAYRGYEYFLLADGRIVIVRPNTLEVVYIISA